ncbi:transcriptional regulator [Jatrophihabitans endophyticus]|uniref:Transcriptional regulator n=1 Tax=Jatrophihabitans endophyticus TaxID=1206085 RepID=A0A1M5K4Q0_9ACTN|nr:LysR family transcriptional regulator [Jatrophihabitans endophyticus]SHG47755.1 transcriptional regulator [Jatrophihabitans endophyticus]
MAYETAGLAPGLEQLVAVVEAGSITAAAVRLGTPQPTLSRAIARLGRELGTELVVRDGRGVRLTRQGEQLAEHATRALREVRAGVATVRADADADAGHVVLGFLHSMGPRAVPSLLRGFRDAHPGVSIGLVQEASDVVLDGVLAGRIDLALASPVPDRPELRRRALARQPLVAVVPAKHRLAARSRVRPADLAGEPVITLRPGYGVRSLTDALLRRAGLPLTYAFESDEMTTVAGLVAAGLGVAVLPRGAASGSGAVEIALSAPGPARVISLAWSARRTSTAPVTALRRHLLAHGPPALASA